MRQKNYTSLIAFSVILVSLVVFFVASEHAYSQSQVTEANCIDSDRNEKYPDGKNYYEGGFIKFNLESEEKYHYTGSDDCIPQGGKFILVEEYCDAGLRKTLNYECPYGCTKYLLEHKFIAGTNRLVGVCLTEEQVCPARIAFSDAERSTYLVGKVYQNIISTYNSNGDLIGVDFDIISGSGTKEYSTKERGTYRFIIDTRNVPTGSYRYTYQSKPYCKNIVKAEHYADIVSNKNLFKNDRIEVIKGWSAMPVSPKFVGKSLNELAHTGQEGKICADTALNQAGWMFNNTNKQWVIMQNFGKTLNPLFKPTERFSKDDAWSLLWIKTQNDCTLGCGVTSCMTGSR